jgi:hypothetical protein
MAQKTSFIAQGNMPVSWDMSDLYELKWQPTHHRDEAVNQRYLQSGHSFEHMVIDICQQDQTLPAWTKAVAAATNLQKHAVALHRMRPGRYLPLHIDLYGAYKQINHITDQTITRVIVFLEDHKPGHMLDIDGNIIGHWRAGDWVSWQDDTLHAAYNMGTDDRYTLQITGYR